MFQTNIWHKHSGQGLAIIIKVQSTIFDELMNMLLLMCVILFSNMFKKLNKIKGYSFRKGFKVGKKLTKQKLFLSIVMTTVVLQFSLSHEV